MRTNTEHMAATCDGQVELREAHASQQSTRSSKQEAKGTLVKTKGGEGCQRLQSEDLSLSTVNCCTVVTLTSRSVKVLCCDEELVDKGENVDTLSR